MPQFSQKLKKLSLKSVLLTLTFILLLTLTGTYFKETARLKEESSLFKNKAENYQNTNNQLTEFLASASGELADLKNQNQYQINKKLSEELENIKKIYLKAMTAYEKLLDLRGAKKGDKLDELFAGALKLLSETKYASAEAMLASLDQKIDEEKQKQASTFKIPENVPADNKPPASGYRRQKVTLDIGSFLVDIISADLNSTRVVVDTASDSDCADNCPVLSLGEYVSRSSAFAGVNGSYFCPATYPQCAGKKNSFDTLLMNKKKFYFNSGNNVYSTLPAVIFQGNSARFVTQSLEWGRDTGVDAVIANQPLLVFNSKVAFGGSSDPKQGNKGGRSFVGATGNTVYVGVVHNATVAEAARVLQALGLDNALNLDDGGSTALWYSGYKAGPGRNIPNAVLFTKR